jgi:hypothetical protein
MGVEDAVGDGIDQTVGGARHQHVSPEQRGARAPGPKAGFGRAVAAHRQVGAGVEVDVAKRWLDEVNAAEGGTAPPEEQAGFAAGGAPAAIVQDRQRRGHFGRRHQDVDVVGDPALEVVHVERGERHTL